MSDVTKATGGCLVFVTGYSGAGKTTLAEGLKHKHDFIHFDGESWMCGMDPIEEAGVTPTAEVMAKVDPDRAALSKAMQSCCAKITAGEEPEASAYENFYSAMLADVKASRAKLQGKDIVISHAPYLRVMRDFCRTQLDGDVIFLVINASVEVLRERVKKRLETFATAQGKTLEEFIMGAASPGKNTFEERMEAMMGNVKGLSEAVESDEPNTFELLVTAQTDADAVLNSACSHLGII